MRKTVISRLRVRVLMTALAATTCCLLPFPGSVTAKGKPGGGGGTGPQYVVIDLGPGRAEALNNVGGVAGQDDTDQPLLWEIDSNGTVTTTVLPLPGGGLRGWVDDINDDFQVVGSGQIDDGTGAVVSRAVLWEVPVAGAVMTTELPGLPVAPGNHSSSVAYGISSSGLIAGTSTEWDSTNTTVMDSTAVVWHVDGAGQVSTIALPSGPSEARDVNSNGIVVTGNGELVVLSFTSGGVIEGVSAPIRLPGLGGIGQNASRITDSGRIAGSATRPDGQRVAVVWNVDTETLHAELVELGTLPRTDRSFAFGVNAQQAVGTCSTDVRSGVKLTPLFADNGNLTDLNKLLIDSGGLKSLELTTDINDLGDICGEGTTRTDARAFVAIPVP